jgi:hypothetical protein
MPEHRSTAPPIPDQTSRPRPEETEPAVEQDPRPGLDLSLTQVVGGALAAMTAATLGSRLGLAGTVVGAALASVVAAVGGSLYTASLRRTRDRVRSVVTSRSRTTLEAPAAEAPGVPAAVTARPLPRLTGPADTSQAKVKRRRVILVRSLIGALATFVLAAVALTTVEVATGGALSGGDRTTFSQVQQGGRDDRTEADAQPSESAEPSPSAAEETEPFPTAEPSPSQSPEPSANPTGEVPAETPTSQPSSEPTAEPSTSAPSAGPTGPA